MFSAKQSLLVATAAYSSATGKSLRTLSRELLGSGSRLQAISNGGDLTTGKCELAMNWLSDNWPDDTDWPTGVLRPAIPSNSVTQSEAAATVSPDMPSSGVRHG